MSEKFSFSTITEFDNHIEKSIPGFNNMMSAVYSMSEYFFNEQFGVYDLGCSTGKFISSLETKCRKFGYDIETNLLPPGGPFVRTDLNCQIPFPVPACLAYSIFTMQFLNPERRESFLREIYDALIPGGAFIIAEKVYLADGKLQQIFNFTHYDHKLKSFSAEEILTKERDLRLIMHPTINYQLDELIEKTGFRYYTTFWQMLNFKAIICIK